MDRIVLEVNDQTAKAWRNTSAKIRAKIEKTITDILDASLTKSKDANFELLLKDARKDAAKNGLTNEILQQILNEEN